MKMAVIFAIRNIKKYFRDKGVLLFSFLSVFIVVALYMFFLAQMQIDNVESILGKVDGIDAMIYTWVIGGLLCIPAISVPLIILCFKVDDVVEKTQDDLLVTPIKRSNIMFGYVIAAWLVGFVMTIITYVLCQFFLLFKVGDMISFGLSLKVLAFLLLLIVSFSGFSFFIVQFQKSNSALTVINSTLNMLIGFFLGLYVPVGMLSDKVALVIKSFPLIQISSLIRKTIMTEHINNVFKNAPAHVVTEIKELYGIDIVLGKVMLNMPTILLILSIFGIMFYIVSAMAIKFRKNV